MTKVARLGTSLAGMILLLSAAGCAGVSGHYDYGFRASDAAGLWQSKGDSPPVVLDLQPDGTFLATGWPLGLYCDGTTPEVGEEPERLWTETVDYSGTWKLGGKGAEYFVWFSSPYSECKSTWGAVAWTGDGESSRLRVEMSPLTPSEELTDDLLLYFEKQ